MDSKALREVIPTQLAQILSAITGRPPKLFDYKTCKFMTSSQIKDEFFKFILVCISRINKSAYKQI